MLREYGITEEEYDKYAGVYKNALEEIKIAEGVDPGKEPSEERQKQINEVKQYVEEMQQDIEKCSYSMSIISSGLMYAKKEPSEKPRCQSI